MSKSFQKECLSKIKSDIFIPVKIKHHHIKETILS